MKILTLLLTISSLIIHFECTPYKSTEPSPIRYELSVTTPSFHYEKSIHNEDVITSKDHAFSITVLSDVPILCPGMLDISPETYYFWMDKRGLEHIESGTFDNQNITEEIRLEYNKLRRIDTGTFRGLKVKKIDLAYNKINHIEDDAFIDLPNLQDIILMNNELVEFSVDSFVQLPKLESFLINNNKLKKLKKGSFSFMTNKKNVIVGASHNEIEEIDPETFDGVTVWNLALNDNKLEQIAEEVFSKNAISFLFLENNQLKSLPGAFYQQKSLQSVDVSRNPLECDDLKRLNELPKTIAVMFNKKNCSIDDIEKKRL